MKPFIEHRGVVLPLERNNVDTDQIIPKQFLKRIERTGYQDFLFYDWRQDPHFVLNLPQYKAASILIAGNNLGCGSSREHAAWALLDYGFRVVIAPSFADIFLSNALKNGIVTVALPEAATAALSEIAKTKMYPLSVSLASKQIWNDHGFRAEFHFDEFRRQCLMRGLDDIALTLQHEEEISAYEISAYENLGLAKLLGEPSTPPSP